MSLTLSLPSDRLWASSTQKEQDTEEGSFTAEGLRVEHQERCWEESHRQEAEMETQEILTAGPV